MQAACPAEPFFLRVNIFVSPGHLEGIELLGRHNTQTYAVHCGKQHIIICHKLLRAALQER